jgi:gliding motility-associated-like protein
MRWMNMQQIWFVAVLLGLVFAAPRQAFAQGCDNPIPVCGEIPEPLSLSFVQSLEVGCVNSPYVSVLEFMTNGNVVNTGNATIDVGGVACQTDGVDDVIEAVVVKPDPQALCDVGAYEIVATCAETGGGFSMVTSDLLPNTTYLIIIGTAHDPSLTPCNLTVFLSGPAVSIDACCTTNIAPGQSVTLTVTGGDESLGYTWFPNYGISSTTDAEIIASPDVTTTYSVSGFFGGCQYSDAVTITVGNPLGIPTSFTPNGDLINDLWSIDGLTQYNQADVRIYDRWGQLVYRSIGYAQPWDGKNGGNDVPVGTYYYAINLNDPQLVDLETITGFISIIR